MSKSSEQSIREFAEKWAFIQYKDELGLLIDDDRTKIFISDLTARIKEYFVPKEEAYPKAFVEWIGFNSATLYYRDVDEKWIKTRFEMSENPSEEYDEYTTDELFNYWKENEQ